MKVVFLLLDYLKILKMVKTLKHMCPNVCYRYSLINFKGTWGSSHFSWKHFISRSLYLMDPVGVHPLVAPSSQGGSSQ